MCLWATQSGETTANARKNMAFACTGVKEGDDKVLTAVGGGHKQRRRSVHGGVGWVRTVAEEAGHGCRVGCKTSG